MPYDTFVGCQCTERQRHHSVEDLQMPFTFNGVGTSLYGARDFRPDGSYITTEWLVFIYAPVLPLKSMRIIATGNNRNYFFYASTGYRILERTKLNIHQVFSVYLWFAVVACSIWSAVGLGTWWLTIPCILAFGAPWFLRRRAIKRMQEKWHREEMGLAAMTLD